MRAMRAIGWTLVLALALAPAAARAQDTTTTVPTDAPAAGAADQADEDSLLKQGVALRGDGRDAEAFDLFSKAWERYHSPRAEAQLGLTAQALGRWALAETHLNAALESEDKWITGHRRTLENALKVVRKRLGSLEVLADAPDAEVLVDGQVLGKLPLGGPLRLPAGTAVLQVQAPGYLPVQRSVTVVPEQLGRESFQLVRVQALLPPTMNLPPTTAASPAAAAPAAVLGAQTTPAPEASPGRHLGVLYGGAAATIVGVGLTTWSGLNTLSARDRYVAQPTEELYKDGIGRQRRTNMLLIGTCVLAATTVAWGLISNWGAR